MRLNGLESIVRVKSSHWPLISSWYEERGLKTPIKGNMSDMGFIADGRVAGWLYLTNSNIAMIEGIISDPHTIPSLRKASLAKLTGAMIDMALALGYTTILGITKHPSVKKLAKQYGFKETDNTVMILEDRG